MGAVDSWNLRVVLACLHDWRRETAEVPAMDVERCLESSGFVCVREGRRLRLWRNSALGLQYTVPMGAASAAPRLVESVRDDLIATLSRFDAWSDE